ncbi:type IV secretion system protein VirB3 [Bartonella machadoae]|uniref:type IV secretion system protein VirB3 n=1 Tax=Bartonella machadoae TaxID=2893471 RepID=UPI001F4C9191|nr:type IV secretion system protein VirB3 [Bartonella machadoae]UNE53861.1 type IV secretion system protein VirB3 [Bartonella machadoae]
MKERDKLTEDTLFLACTRPAMIAGVTVEAMGLNAMGTMILFIMTGNIFLITLGIAIHFIFKEILKHDHNKFRILFIWQQTTVFSSNSHLWGGASLSPLRLVRTYEELK